MPHGIYMPGLADKLKNRAGLKWRPSNGTEGALFIESWCNKCARDKNKDCPILGAAMMYDVEDDGYPKEWQYGEDGQPKCTAFEPKAGRTE